MWLVQPAVVHTVVTLAIAIGLLAAVLFAVIARRSGAEKAYAPVRGGDSDDEDV